MHGAGSSCTVSTETAARNILFVQEDTKDKGWWQWPLPIRKREPAALEDATARHKTDIERFIALQYLFDRQWKAVKVPQATANYDSLPSEGLHQPFMPV